MLHYVGLETAASGIDAYHPTTIHGLLQTEAYARAQSETDRPIEDFTKDSAEAHIAVRMERKRIVLAKGTKLRIILGEAALRTEVGNAEVMAEQYRELIRLGQGNTPLSLHVLTFARAYRAESNFAVLDLGRLPGRVQVDNAWGALSTTEKPAELRRFRTRFDTMIGAALSTDDTIDFLKQLLE
ncbi:DUF5753 domain-containing protein [Streptomyces sp. NPDC088141]|uniref:DUF5753 domain-containing protein n=1 Tax=unclassified Streptomyces TaxID=2593676 RepID=UPI00343B2E28